jgi:hypothetical protein
MLDVVECPFCGQKTIAPCTPEWAWKCWMKEQPEDDDDNGPGEPPSG